MRDLLIATPVIVFGVLFVFKVIKTFSLRGFFNLGKLKTISMFEVLDFVMMSILAYTSLRYSFKSEFSGLFIEWVQVIGSIVILYRFFYMGMFRMLFKNESILVNGHTHSFFRRRT